MSRKGSHPESQQAEQLADIGAYLQTVRQEANLSLEQINATTLIRPNLLMAIEAGQIQSLPEPIYIRGLIKRYADALGLDGAELAATFPVTPTVRPVAPSWRDLPAAQLRPLHLYVAYIILITAAISGLSHMMERSATPVSEDRTVNQPLSIPMPTEPAPVVPEVAPAPVSNQPVRVEVSVTAPSWVRVVADGETTLEETLTAGSQHTWTANSQLTIVAGNAGGIVVTYNDGQAQPLGEPGTVAEVTYSAAAATAAQGPDEEAIAFRQLGSDRPPLTP
jgi:cytoskeletal protein RodZ